MKYKYIDGDNIGLMIESSFLENDEYLLAEINRTVKKAINDIEQYLIDNKQEIIFSGADGVICKGSDLQISELLDFTRQLNNKILFSIGIGCSLSDAYIALRYAKSQNKDIAVERINNVYKIIDGHRTKKTLPNSKYIT